MPSRSALRLGVILLCLVQASLAAAAVPKFSAIYVFGDSFSDVGNIYAATKGVDPPSPPYFEGRFSNGPLWVEHVAHAMGLPMKPSLLGGTDYAYGGALATSDLVTPYGTIPSVPSQVFQYLAQHGNKADPNALYVLEGGGNDVIHASGVSAEAVGVAVAREIAQCEYFLRLAGATRFLIPNLFDIAILPDATNKEFATRATKAVNRNLDVYLAIDQNLQQVRIYRVDSFQLVAALTADPAHFGFNDIVNPCLNATTFQACASPLQTLLWDSDHFTVFGQSFFAVAAEAVLSQP